jgi:hypothetical protein
MEENREKGRRYDMHRGVWRCGVLRMRRGSVRASGRKVVS